MKIKVVPNTEDIKEAINNNNGYCPCKLEKIPENKCICEDFLNMNKIGKCKCGRYEKIEI